MQGDIVSKQQPSTNTPPQAGPTSNRGSGYGSSSFGASSATVTATQTAQTGNAAGTAPLLEAPAAESLLPEKAGKQHNRTTLVLTVVGILVFAVGAIGLFLYALI